MRLYDLIVEMDNYNEKDRLRHKRLLQLNLNKENYSKLFYFIKTFYVCFATTKLSLINRIKFSYESTCRWVKIPQTKLCPSVTWSEAEQAAYYEGRMAGALAVNGEKYTTVNSNGFNIGFVEEVFKHENL